MVTVTTQTTSPPVEQSTQAAHFWLAVIALGMGGFAIGTTEFVTMGVLPQVADGVGVSIPVAGHLISAYALGVVVGAPVIAFLGAKLPRRGLLLGLMAVYAVFNLASALAPGYGSLLVARFLDGLPHGGFFGVSSLVAASMVAPERRGRAISLVFMGLPLANVAGVPLTTWLGQSLGWRSAYATVAGLSVLAVLLVALFVPSCPGNPHATGRRELAALRHPQLWYAMVAGAIGFGGMFALFSYVAPMVTHTGGLSSSTVPVFLLAMGLGMVFGNWVAGRLADWSLSRMLLGAPVALGLALLIAWLLAPTGWPELVGVFLVPAVGSSLALGMMLRLIDAAGHAETLGAAASHASLNVGNALGAWLGGLTIAAGWGYRSPLLVGVLLSLAGFAVLAVAARADRVSAHSELVTS
jgi:MFS transporter, DHA1 family, inner membrane transport protein